LNIKIIRKEKFNGFKPAQLGKRKTLQEWNFIEKHGEVSGKTGHLIPFIQSVAKELMLSKKPINFLGDSGMVF
jgi:hypothetical protein